MEHLIRRYVPQRTAHHLVGALVRRAIDRGVPLEELTLDEFRAEYADFDESVFDVLGTERAVASFTSYGSTAPEQVAAQVDRWKEQLKM